MIFAMHAANSTVAESGKKKPECSSNTEEIQGSRFKVIGCSGRRHDSRFDWFT
jgi:hypothetical protein